MSQNEACSDVSSKNPIENAPNCDTPKPGNSLQRHLYSKKKSLVKSHDKDDIKLKRNLRRKMKPNELKMTPNTPEKSEIMKMFENMGKRKEQKMSQGSQNVENINANVRKSSMKSDVLPVNDVENDKTCDPPNF